MRILRFFFRSLKGIYDILATYLLGWIVFFAALSVVFHFALGGARITAALEHLSIQLGLPHVFLRLIAFGTLHAVAIWFLRPQIAVGQAGVEHLFDAIASPIKRGTASWPRLKLVLEGIFTLVVTAALIPFLIQPTLVAGFDRHSWLERGANLLDGTTTVGAADSVVGFYRLLVAEPEAVEPLQTDEAIIAIKTIETDEAFEPAVSVAEPNDLQSIDPSIDSSISPTTTPTPPPSAPTSSEPMMDRWDDHIRAVSHGDPQRFAQIKAFMRVESAGRQFAVSPTGCSGLMQFCAPTARDRHHRKIFGTGQVYVCGCRGKCRIANSTQRRLESGDLSAANEPGAFPCQITDARFDAHKSIEAGAAFIDRLHKSYGGNLYLMYIGYNSGPAVANTVWRRVGHNPNADLDLIAAHLADAMGPYYGQGSRARANSLLNTHLPRLKRGFDRYHLAENSVKPINSLE